MLKLVVIFVFFMLHIQYLAVIVFWGQTDHEYHNIRFSYGYSTETAVHALIFTLLCLGCFLAGYFAVQKRRYIGDIKKIKSSLAKDSSIFDITIVLFLLQCAFHLFCALKNGFVYNDIAFYREKNLSFFYEMRTIPNILFSYILLNSNKKDWQTPKFKRLIYVLIIYGGSILLSQTRSLFFEYSVIFGFYWLRTNGNKFKWKYILYLYIASLIPNLMILTRFNIEDITFKGIFTYEYSLIFNNILSETIVTFRNNFLYGDTILTGFKLVVPSFLRDILDVNIDKSILINTAHDAGVFGGGFSLLAELYMNWGYSSCIFFMLFGAIISYFNNHIFYRKSIPFFYSMGPLIYSYFILAFRNDLSAFIKQIIQLFIISFFILFLMKVSQKQTQSK